MPTNEISFAFNFVLGKGTFRSSVALDISVSLTDYAAYSNAFLSSLNARYNLQNQLNAYPELNDSGPASIWFADLSSRSDEDGNSVEDKVPQAHSFPH
jgi:hypothetical protein